MGSPTRRHISSCSLAPPGISPSSLTSLSMPMLPIGYATSDCDWFIILEWPLTNSVLILYSDMNNSPPRARSAVDPPVNGSHVPVHPLTWRRLDSF